MMRRASSVLVFAMFVAAPAAALDVQVKQVRAAASLVKADLELRDALPDRFKKLLDDGGVLHLRVQAELWESRPVWDRLVYPAIVRVFRLAKVARGQNIDITDPDGATASYTAVPNPFPIMVEIGKSDRLEIAKRYYVHAIATVGTLAEHEIDDMGDAVFGRPSETNTLGALGRMMFRKVLEIGDYLQSISAETRSRKEDGGEILKP